MRDAKRQGLVFNRTISLKDSWKPAATPSAPEPSPKPVASTNADTDGRRARKRRAKSEVMAELHAADPELAARATRYREELGIAEGDVTTLTSDRALSDFFEAALSAHDNPRGIANWVVNAVRAAAKDTDIDQLPFGPQAIGQLVALLDDNTISSKGAKRVFQELSEAGGQPDQIVERLGLAQLAHPDQIAPIVEQVMKDNPGQLAQYRDGNQRLFGFFVGQVIRASGGRANPEVVNQLLRDRLNADD